MAKLPRVANDTNVWFSALYFSGKPAKIANLIEESKIASVISQPLLDELREQMLTTFETPPFLANVTISYIKSISRIVSLEGVDYGLRDPADNKVLETAVVGDCQWLITGDKDLLSLGSYEDIQIVTPDQFLAKYRKRG